MKRDYVASSRIQRLNATSVTPNCSRDETLEKEIKAWKHSFQTVLGFDCCYLFCNFGSLVLYARLSCTILHVVIEMKEVLYATRIIILSAIQLCFFLLVLWKSDEPAHYKSVVLFGPCSHLGCNCRTSADQSSGMAFKTIEPFIICIFSTGLCKWQSTFLDLACYHSLLHIFPIALC